MSVSKSQSPLLKALFSPAVIVASLGYFVDIFDLLLFSIVRRPSLASLGLNEAEQVQKGLMLHNTQMIGMLFGGIIWGVLADKKGRLSVLFGSIILYSVGNIANAFVHSVEAYAFWRFVAGLGLAGELGAGITLVAETLSKEHRGYGTALVASIGVSGAVVGGLVGEFFDWRVTYIIGGVLGFALLLLRVNTAESLLFKNAKIHGSHKGNFLSLFKDWSKAQKFLKCILIGVPIWFVIGTLIQLSPEFSKALHVDGVITAGRAVIFCYGGLVFGDLLSGLLSQYLKSRLRVVFIFLGGLAFFECLYFFLTDGVSAATFYFICFGLGFFAGYWAVFVTLAAEQFGTNLRGTVATSVPNFVRASVVPMSLSFTALKGNLGMLMAAQVVGVTVLLIAFFSAFLLEESFGKDLGYYEID